MTKQQALHEVLDCVHARVHKIATPTPTSTSKVTKKKKRRQVPKKKNYTIFCDCEICCGTDAMILICLRIMLYVCFITLFISHLMV